MLKVASAPTVRARVCVFLGGVGRRGGYVLLMNTHAAERAYLSAHIWHRRCESTRLDGACLSGQLTIRLHLRVRR